MEFKEFNTTIIPFALVGYETVYNQLGATRLVGYLPSHIHVSAYFFLFDSLTDQSAIIILLFHKLGCNEVAKVNSLEMTALWWKSAKTYEKLLVVWRENRQQPLDGFVLHQQPDSSFAMGPPSSKTRHYFTIFFQISSRTSTGLPGWKAFPNLSLNSTLAYVFIYLFI